MLRFSVMCVCALHTCMCRCSGRPGMLKIPAAGVKSSCELANVDAADWPPVSCEGSQSSELLRHLSFPKFWCCFVLFLTNRKTRHFSSSTGVCSLPNFLLYDRRQEDGGPNLSDRRREDGGPNYISEPKPLLENSYSHVHACIKISFFKKMVKPT